MKNFPLVVLLCLAVPALAEYPAFDLESATVTLNNGLAMPTPGSSSPDHILENISIFDFERADDEMAQMTAPDRNERFADY